MKQFIKKPYIGLILIPSLAILVFGLWKLYQFGDTISKGICVSSFLASLRSQLYDHEDVLIDHPVASCPGKSTFTEKDYQKLLTVLQKYKFPPLDRGGLSSDASDILLDAWGHRVIIFVCRDPNSEDLSFIGLSRGPDGIVDTPDDITSP